MDNKFMGEDDLVLNTAARIPVCLCIDTSASMNKAIDPENLVFTGEQQFIDGQYWDICEAGDTLMSEMVKGVNKFYDAIKNDDQALASCEVAVVSFDDTAKLLSDFSSVDKKEEFTTPTDGETTQMGAGLDMALDVLNKRKKQYNENGIEYYQPWLVIFTDGEPTDKIYRAQAKIRELEDAKKLTVFCLALDKEVNMDVLSSLSKRPPINVKNDKFSEFFEWLGKSVSVVSNSRVGEGVKLDLSTMSDWAEI
ncbi:MAG: VWA domain-containing protein [bacterium]